MLRFRIYIPTHFVVCGWNVNLVFKAIEVLFLPAPLVCYLEANLEPDGIPHQNSVVKPFAVLYVVGFIYGLLSGLCSTSYRDLKYPCL